MFMDLKEEDNIITLKLIGFLCFLIGIWFVNLFIPVHMYHRVAFPMTYVFRMVFVCYTLVIIFSIVTIKNKTEKIENKDVIMAFTLGALGGSTDIFLATTIVVAYIASMVILSESKRKIPFIKTPTDGLDVWFIIFLYVFFYRQFNNLHPVPVAYGFYRALMPSITDGVVWRLFLFAVTMKITKGEFSNKKHKLIIWLILILPFAVMSQPRNYEGVGHPITYVSISEMVWIILPMSIITWFFLKRSLLAAMLVTFLINAYNSGIAYYNAGADIFYWVQPTILEIVFGVGL